MAYRSSGSGDNRPIPELPRFVDYFVTLLDRCEFSQREIAGMIGLPQPNVISMIKNGRMKVPLDRIPDLAWALSADPYVLLVLALNDEHPKLLEVLREHMGISVSTLHLASLARTPRPDSGGISEPETDTVRSPSQEAPPGARRTRVSRDQRSRRRE